MARLRPEQATVAGDDYPKAHRGTACPEFTPEETGPAFRDLGGPAETDGQDVTPYGTARAPQDPANRRALKRSLDSYR